MPAREYLTEGRNNTYLDIKISVRTYNTVAIPIPLTAISAYGNLLLAPDNSNNTNTRLK